MTFYFNPDCAMDFESEFSCGKFLLVNLGLKTKANELLIAFEEAIFAEANKMLVSLETSKGFLQEHFFFSVFCKFPVNY